jgi:hypothetical protein
MVGQATPWTNDTLLLKKKIWENSVVEVVPIWLFHPRDPGKQGITNLKSKFQKSWNITPKKRILSAIENQ